jgi:ArsR family transcriptional regulator, virulence genes transcriptional regulator
MNNISIYDLQADLCRAMSHAGRQKILHILFDGKKRVTDIINLTGLSQSAVSRHLTVLKNNGIVIPQRHGQEVFYTIANPKIIEVCNLMRAVLSEQYTQNSDLIHTTQEK